MKNRKTLSYFVGFALLHSSILFSSIALAQTSATNEKVYSFVSEMPEYEGGTTEMLNFIARNIQYPQEAKEAGAEGLVVATFIVETNGSLSDIKVEKCISASIDAEAERIVSLTSGKWKIGKHNNKAVRVRYTLPIKFSLDADNNPAVLHRMPQFKGGQVAMVRTIYEHLNLPAAVQQENISALLDVNFTIDVAGSVSNIAIAGTKIKKTVGAGTNMDYMDASTFKVQNKAILAMLSEAAAEAVKSTSGSWEPGLRNGKPIAAEVTLPVLLSASGQTDPKQQLNTMLLTYQSDAYDRKTVYETNEVDISPTLKEMPLEKFLAKHLRYPDTSFEGIVKVSFLVFQDGRFVGPITSVSDTQKAVADEITRVFKLTEKNWLPARKNTQPVTTMHTITINFVPEHRTGKPSSPTSATVVVSK
ncbi:TonB family protein [Pontibacter sp. MBLB2868]|uniref:TonB family protein n=1 Tax=Pontibacter sp. MBLB2868 TaxID=3451555 RepID=UPI003F74F4E0